MSLGRGLPPWLRYDDYATVTSQQTVNFQRDVTFQQMVSLPKLSELVGGDILQNP
jgi:hypothetical protein